MMTKQIAAGFVAMVFLASCHAPAATSGALPGFHLGQAFGEQIRIEPIPGGRTLIDAPPIDQFNSAKPTTLIFYALPNGNTIEQTIGCAPAPGVDWHYNIQHIGAQLRMLRSIDESRNYVIAYLEADKKSWPAWTQTDPDAGTHARRIIELTSRLIDPPPANLALIAHSGGGAFVTEFINAPGSMPANLTRIVYLDAYYKHSSDAATAQKLRAWLNQNINRHLILVCYDDRNIELNGKKVITTPDGGSFRAAHRLLDQLSDHHPPTTQSDGPIDDMVFDHDQIHFIFHNNPQNLILHTRLVEWNGFLRAMTIDSLLPQTWAKLEEQRDYDRWIQPSPTSLPSTLPTTQPATRPMTGSQFIHQIAAASLQDREEAIAQQILSGNTPKSLQRFVPVRVQMKLDGKVHIIEYQVSPDYLSIGSDDDFVRMPMLPATAQRIADAMNCILPTKKMVDDIDAHATLRLSPQPLTQNRESPLTFLQHQQLIQQQLAGRPIGQLICGIKKDIIITNHLKEHPHCVAIYGWRKLDGQPIQPLYCKHLDTYTDYSHGVRLIKNDVILDGKATTLQAVLADPSFCELVSDEGMIQSARYP